MRTKEGVNDDSMAVLNKEIESPHEDNRSKNIRQYETRRVLEERLQEMHLNRLLDLNYYTFDDGDEE